MASDNVDAVRQMRSENRATVFLFGGCSKSGTTPGGGLMADPSRACSRSLGDKFEKSNSDISSSVNVWEVERNMRARGKR